MANYKVVEIFSSINGEGTRAGQLAVFVRMQGCNLNCAYCDTVSLDIHRRNCGTASQYGN